MILSHRQIEEIAIAVTNDFNAFFFGSNHEKNRKTARATPIDQFAKDYLGLSVSYTNLSLDGSICGLTAYTDTEYITEEMGVRRIIPLKMNQILMDSSFIQPKQLRKLCGKRRFTLAHECAHQILFQLDTDEMKDVCKRKYSACRAYSFRDLKTHEDWNEWQANALGAAILMPQKEIDLAMGCFANGNKLVRNKGVFGYRDELSLMMLCQQLGVSKTAAVIRLRQLGYIEERTDSQDEGNLEVRV